MDPVTLIVAALSAGVGAGASDSIATVKKLTRLITDTVARERAFGVASKDGDIDRLMHLAKRWNSTYEEFLDWAASMRGVSVPLECQDLLQAAARFADGPIEQYRLFIDDYVVQLDALPDALSAGTDIHLGGDLVFYISPEIMQDYYVELERLKRQIKRQGA
jgi:hypothetical protein